MVGVALDGAVKGGVLCYCWKWRAAVCVQHVQLFTACSNSISLAAWRSWWSLLGQETTAEWNPHFTHDFLTLGRYYHLAVSGAAMLQGSVDMECWNQQHVMWLWENLLCMVWTLDCILLFRASCHTEKKYFLFLSNFPNTEGIYSWIRVNLMDGHTSAPHHHIPESTIAHLKEGSDLIFLPPSSSLPPSSPLTPSLPSPRSLPPLPSLPPSPPLAPSLPSPLTCCLCTTVPVCGADSCTLGWKLVSRRVLRWRRTSLLECEWVLAASTWYV